MIQWNVSWLKWMTLASPHDDIISLLVARQVRKHRSILLWVLVVLGGEALPSRFRPLLFEYPNALHYRWRRTSSAFPRRHPAATDPATLLYFLELSSAPQWSQSFWLAPPETGAQQRWKQISYSSPGRYSHAAHLCVLYHQSLFFFFFFVIEN